MKNKEIKVGILALICGVALYFGFNFLKGEDFFSTTNKYVVYYENVDGLTISNPVVVDGFAIGRVKNMNLEIVDGKRRVKIVLDVRDDIPVGDSTVAVLTSSDLLGGKAIVLRLGKNSTLYKTGDVLIGTTERSITEELEDRVRPVLNTLDTTLNRVNHLIDPEDKNIIKRSLQNMERTTALLEKMAGENRRTFNEVGDQLKGLMVAFAETERKIAPLFDKMGVFADSLNTLHLAETIRDVESAIANMNAIMMKINSTDGTVGMLMNDKQLYEKLNKSLISMDSLMNHINTNPDHFMAPLGKSQKQIEKENRKNN